MKPSKKSVKSVKACKYVEAYLIYRISTGCPAPAYGGLTWRRKSLEKWIKKSADLQIRKVGVTAKPVYNRKIKKHSPINSPKK